MWTLRGKLARSVNLTISQFFKMSYIARRGLSTLIPPKVRTHLGYTMKDRIVFFLTEANWH